MVEYVLAVLNYVPRETFLNLTAKTIHDPEFQITSVHSSFLGQKKSPSFDEDFPIYQLLPKV